MSETLSNLSHEDRRFPPSADFAAAANVKADAYDEADEDPAGVLGEAGEAVDVGAGVVRRCWTGPTRRSRSGSSAAS